MKQFFTFLALFGCFTGLFAKPVSPEKARQVAGYFYEAHAVKGSQYKNGAAMKLAFTSSSKAYSNASLLAPVNYFYVFNAGDKNGFVIVAADDNVTPVLAYSNEGEILQDNIPTNVAKWLEGYRFQLQYVIENNIEAGEEIKAQWDNYYNERTLGKKETNEVAPLMKTKWNQSPYYNALCPYDATRNARAVTGCVATAMAQVMKYWNYPEQGTGFHSYNHNKFGTLSANFGNTKYDWASMPNSVTSNNNAVATLMAHCGVSVDMNYSVDVSGAYVINDYTATEHCSEYALEKYFGYSDKLQGVQRKDYTNSQWDNLLKGELDANRPIIYAGFGSGGGHAFVCDGYDANGLFHFNWGWGGYYDGYFVSTALDPGGVGTGGGTGGYNSDQQAIIGVQPPNGGGGGGGGNSGDSLMLYNYVNVNISTAYYGGAFTVSTAIANLGTEPFTGDFCAAIFDNAGTFVDFIETKTNLQLDNGFYYNMDFVTPGMLSALPGKYSIGVFVKPTGGEWSIVANGNYSNYAEISIINPNDLELYSNMVVTPGASDLVQNQPATVKVDFANYGTSEYNGVIDVSLYNLDGTFAATVQTIQNIQLCSNCHFTAPLTFTTTNLDVAPGTYLMAVLHSDDGEKWQIAGSSYYTNPIKVIVKSPEIQQDAYEDNNTAAKAYNVSTTYSNNRAVFRSNGANIHQGADYDYYKVTLPAGYDYTITARVHDAENSTNGVYTNDVLFSYSKGGTTWSDAYDATMPGKINVKGGTTLYFLVAPYFQGSTGTYLLDADITRIANTGVEETIENQFTLWPNPAKDYLQLTLSENSANIKGVKIVDVSGREILSFNQDIIKDKRAVLPVESLVNGVYFVVVETDKGTWKNKFVKVQ